MKRLSFTPSDRSLEYFAALMKRLKDESRLPVRVTQRTAFDVLVKYARESDPHEKQRWMRAVLKSGVAAAK